MLPLRHDYRVMAIVSLPCCHCHFIIAIVSLSLCHGKRAICLIQATCPCVSSLFEFYSLAEPYRFRCRARPHLHVYSFIFHSRSIPLRYGRFPCYRGHEYAYSGRYFAAAPVVTLPNHMLANPLVPVSLHDYYYEETNRHFNKVKVFKDKAVLSQSGIFAGSRSFASENLVFGHAALASTSLF